MTKSQNAEFTNRVAINVAKLVAKGVNFDEAKKRIFDVLNSEHPHALAAWIKFNVKAA